MLSQLFIQSPRGDVIIYKDFRGNVSKAATDTFFRKVSLWDGEGKDAPPVFQVDGVHFLHAKAGGLLWVATTRENVSPSLVLELLMRMHWIVRDYVGTVSEDAVRRNFVLIYELLDEVLDFGLPQNSSTDRLKQFVAMEPVVGRPRANVSVAFTGPSEVVKSVLDTSRTGAKEEIFVDVIEKLTAIFDVNGHLRASSIVGSIKIKSYLGGNPPIRLGLPEGLVIGRNNPRASIAYSSEDAYGSSGPVVLDTMSMHESVDQGIFNSTGTLQLVPPEGHFDLITYRSSRNYKPPFRIFPVLEDDPYSIEKMSLFLRLRAEYDVSKVASGLEITIPFPPSVQRVQCEMDTPQGDSSSALLGSLPLKGIFEQHTDWKERDHKLTWSLSNLKGGREHVLRVRLTIDPGCMHLVRQDYGPVMVQFVLPGKPSASGMDVKYLKVMKEEKGYNPSRWFRVVALANSYQVRTG